MQKLKNLWYKFKCWAWYQYTTIKPRSLPHTWCDKVDLLPHIMFEVLSRFIEDECNPGNVDWYNPEWNHKIKVNGVERYVKDEIDSLYNWWHKKYLKAYPEFIDSLYSLCSNDPLKLIPSEDSNFSRIEFNPNDSKIYNFITSIENRIDEELEEKMIRLIKIRESLWT